MAPTLSVPVPRYLDLQDYKLSTIYIRDTIQDGTEGPNGVPPVPHEPDYKYPAWGIAIGTLGVALTCVGFAYLCAFLNRRNNKQAAYIPQYSVLDKKNHIASALTTNAAASAAMCVGFSNYADDFSQATLAAEKESEIGTKILGVKKVHMPTRMARVLRRGGKRRVRPEAVDGVAVGVIELKPISSKLEEAKEENINAKLAQDETGGILGWNRSEQIREDGHIERPAPCIVPSSADVNADVDAIAFVTEERFENVDLQ